MVRLNERSWAYKENGERKKELKFMKILSKLGLDRRTYGKDGFESV